MGQRKAVISLLTVTVVAVAIGIVIGTAVNPGAEAGASPVKALSEREVYYPGTEDLAPDEMRVVACGTGMPRISPTVLQTSRCTYR